MTQNEAKVVISGDATSATTSAEQAAAAYQSAFALMKAKLAELGFSFQETFAGMSEAANRGAAGVQIASEKVAASTTLMRHSAAGVKESWETLGSAMSKLNGIFLGVTAALAGGEVFEHAVEATTKYTSEVEKLSRSFGISLPRADGFHAALHKLGIETDTMTALSAKLVRQMRGHEDAFNRLGIATRDTAGHFRDLQDITLDSLERLRDLEAGVDRTGAAQVIFGRGTGDLTDLLKLNREELEEGAKTARELGLVTTEEGVTANREYKQSVREVSEVWDAFQVQLGSTILPYLTRLATWFQENGPSAIRQTVAVVHELASAFATVPAEFRLWEAGLNKLWNSFALTIEDMGRRVDVFELKLQLVGDVISLAMSGNWSAIGQAWERGTALIDDYSNRTADRIIAKWKEVSKALADAQAGMDAAMHAGEKDTSFAGGWDSKAAWHGMMGLHGGAPPPEATSNERLDNIAQGHEPKPKKEKDDLFQHLDEELKSKEIAWAAEQDAQGTAQGYSLQSIADYWQKALGMANLSVKDRLGIEEKYLAARKSLVDEETAKYLAGKKAELDAARGDYAAQLALAQEVLERQKRIYGENSTQAKVAADAVIRIKTAAAEQEKRLAEEVAAFEMKQALAGVEAEREAARFRVEIGRETEGQLIAQERDFENERYQITMKGLQQRLSILDPLRDREAYQKASEAIEDEERKHQAVLTQIDQKAILQRTQMERAAIGQFSSAWAQAIGQLVTLQAGFANTLKSLYQGLQQSISGALAQIIDQWLQKHLEALILGHAQQSVTGAAEVASNAAVAGSAAWASTAAIPIIGPELAPAAAAAAYAGAMAFAPLATAEGGWDIPAGVNPIAQLHKREMVLPEKFADVIRGMADGGGGGGAGGNHLHLHGNIIHNPSQLEAWFKQNASAVGAGVRHYARNGGRMTP